MIKAIIFDLDGVICFTDHYHYLAWKTIADELNVYFDETINNRLRGVSRLDSLNIILERFGGTVSNDQKLLLMDKKNETYKARLAGMTPADLDPETLETMRALRKRGLQLAVGSVSRNAAFILERLGLAGFFDAISDGIGLIKSKPDPEVFLKAAQRLNIQPADCLVVEDAAAGAEAARRAGMMCATLGDASVNGLGDCQLSCFADLLRLGY